MQNLEYEKTIIDLHGLI